MTQKDNNPGATAGRGKGQLGRNLLILGSLLLVALLVPVFIVVRGVSGPTPTEGEAEAQQLQKDAEEAGFPELIFTSQAAGKHNTITFDLNDFELPLGRYEEVCEYIQSHVQSGNGTTVLEGNVFTTAESAKIGGCPHSDGKKFEILDGMNLSLFQSIVFDVGQTRILAQECASSDPDCSRAVGRESAQLILADARQEHTDPQLAGTDPHQEAPNSSIGTPGYPTLSIGIPLKGHVDKPERDDTQGDKQVWAQVSVAGSPNEWAKNHDAQLFFGEIAALTVELQAKPYPEEVGIDINFEWQGAPTMWLDGADRLDVEDIEVEEACSLVNNAHMAVEAQAQHYEFVYASDELPHQCESTKSQR